jgi:hypothetical protein
LKVELDEKRYRDLMRHVQRAEAGDTKAVRKLKRISPKAYEHLMQVYGDLGRSTENALIEAVYSQTWGARKEGNQLDYAGLRRRVDEMKGTLYASHPSPIERLLVDRFICNWIVVTHAEWVAADRAEHVSDDDRFTKWLDRSQRRFMSAAKDLATVGRLLGPNIQVNIAEKQQIANVFGGLNEKTDG